MNDLLNTSTELTHALGGHFRKRAAATDVSGEFVFENYEDLKAHHYFSLLIPQELGGAGLSHKEVCDHIRIIGQYCPSTALCYAMHSHLVATMVWKYKKGQGGEAVLALVAREQLVLVSTGARDWLESNGELTRTEGGYLLNGRKFFASQSSAGDLVVTSAPYADPEKGDQVLHFALPMNSPGVSLADDWDVMGMRGTGSNTVCFDDVFVPESAITLARPKGEFHPFWNIVLTVAMPLIMSAYAGIARRAFDITVAKSRKSRQHKAHLPYLLGEMYNELTSANVHLEDMIRIANNLDFGPSDSTSISILTRKTNVTQAVIKVVTLGMETIGGSSFYRKNEIEKLFRDVQASRFHPLNQWDQHEFVGSRILNENF